MIFKRTASWALPISLFITSTSITAAPIFTNTAITGDTDILNTGALISASNFGTSVATTINGVSFTSTNAGLSNETNGSGDFSTDPFSANLDNLLSSLVFTNNSSPLTLTIGGLSIGTDYRLQLFFSNDLNSTGSSMRISMEGEFTDLSGWLPSARNVTVDFTASSLSSVTTLTQLNSNRTILNGYALHSVSAVPVPAAAWLFISGLIGLLSVARNKAEI